MSLEKMSVVGGSTKTQKYHYVLPVWIEQTSYVILLNKI